MKNLGGRLLKMLGRLGFYSMVPLFVVISLWTTVPLFGLNNTVELPEISPVDQIALDKATASQGGELLTKTGFKATIKISDEDIIKFLDQEEKKAGQANPGPYVVFSIGKPKTAQAEDNGFTDPVVDVSNGAIVAISQEFTNGRGSICFNAKTIDILQGNWVIINQYLKGKSMPQQIPVTRELVPQLTSGFPDTNCFVYPTS
jgi:hypothetical protein